jgi:hypothetical protein
VVWNENSSEKCVKMTEANHTYAKMHEVQRDVFHCYLRTQARAGKRAKAIFIAMVMTMGLEVKSEIDVSMKSIPESSEVREADEALGCYLFVNTWFSNSAVLLHRQIYKEFL